VDADYLTDVLSDKAVDFIKKCSEDEDPFFLYVAYNAPHNPLQATQKYLDRFAHIEQWGRKNYAAMVSAVDDGVGQILQALSDVGVDDNTLLFFLSDNGGASNNSSDNGVLRNHKGSLFEGGLRVPFALRWKGSIPAGTVYTHPIISLDIMATMTALAGAEIAPERPLDGVNLLPFITDKDKGAPHDYLFWRKFDRQGVAVRSGDIKLVDDRKLPELGYAVFNVVEDVSEKENLAEINPDKTEELLEKHAAWKAQLKPTAFPTLGNHKWWKKEASERK
jgi:arylsulfatase A-like enzyme